MKRHRSTTCLHHGGSVLVIVLWTCFGLAALAVMNKRRGDEDKLQFPLKRIDIQLAIVAME